MMTSPLATSAMPLPLRLFPEEASSMARQVDDLFRFLTLFSAVVALGIAVLLLYFAIQYRRGPDRLIGAPILGNWTLEITWIVIPLVIAMYMFYQGSRVYFALLSPPPDSLEVYVVAKQWMWKFQHPEGPREINELHVPADRDIKLIMATEDTIHSFYVPAFRVKADVVPGRYRMAWFRAIKPGRYRLFCAEYCGTNHSGMGGTIVVQTPAEYQDFLTVGKATGSVAAEGEKLFQQLACNTCHRSDRQGRGPVLSGLYGQPVPLTSGQIVVADDNYLRDAILLPQAQVVAGFSPITPSFRDLLSEQQVLLLVAYVKSLGPPAQPAQPPLRSPSPTPTGTGR